MACSEAKKMLKAGFWKDEKGPFRGLGGDGGEPTINHEDEASI